MNRANSSTSCQADTFLHLASESQETLVCACWSVVGGRHLYSLFCPRNPNKFLAPPEEYSHAVLSLNPHPSPRLAPI